MAPGIGTSEMIERLGNKGIEPPGAPLVASTVPEGPHRPGPVLSGAGGTEKS